MLFDLSARVKLRLTGSDRVRFLNGQVTNDVRKANANLSMPACVLNAKGKMDASFSSARSADALFLDAETELRDSLEARLGAISDRRRRHDRGCDRRILAFPRHRRNAAEPSLANGGTRKRFGEDGLGSGLSASEEHDRDPAGACRPVVDLRTGRDAERLRIERGIPRWGRELTDEIIPVEANLGSDGDRLRKGCYIGQEVISRMKMSGQTNKRLCGLISIAQTPLSASMRLFD